MVKMIIDLGLSISEISSNKKLYSSLCKQQVSKIKRKAVWVKFKVTWPKSSIWKLKGDRDFGADFVSIFWMLVPNADVEKVDIGDQNY